MADCIFCQVISGKLPGTFLYRDDKIVVIKDISPQAPVHWLVIPRAHVSEFVEADVALLEAMIRVAKKIIQQEKIVNYRLVNNSKSTALIDHLHLHILGGIDKFRKL